MRQLSPLTNLALAAASAMALVASLSLPWFGTPPPSDGDIAATMERHAQTIARVMTDGGVAADMLLGTARTAIIASAVALIVLCAAMVVPLLRPVLRDVVRVAALVTPAAVAYGAVDAMGPGMELRWGLLASLGLAALAASAAWHGAAARDRRPDASAAWSRATRPGA